MDGGNRKEKKRSKTQVRVAWIGRNDDSHDRWQGEQHRKASAFLFSVLAGMVCAAMVRVHYMTNAHLTVYYSPKMMVWTAGTTAMTTRNGMALESDRARGKKPSENTDSETAETAAAKKLKKKRLTVGSSNRAAVSRNRARAKQISEADDNNKLSPSKSATSSETTAAKKLKKKRLTVGSSNRTAVSINRARAKQISEADDSSAPKLPYNETLPIRKRGGQAKKKQAKNNDADLSEITAAATRAAAAFMDTEFKAYKTRVDLDIYGMYRDDGYKNKGGLNCASEFWNGEFGMELRVYTPWAYYIREACGGVSTRGVIGTKYVYFFSSRHTIVLPPDRRSKRHASGLTRRNPFRSPTVHIRESQIPRDADWQPPPYADFFGGRPEMEGILNNGKPLVVILNKYSQEWEGRPVNYFSIPMLRKMLNYLTPKYTVLYKRHSNPAFKDNNEKHWDRDNDKSLWVAGKKSHEDLKEKEMIRKNYPDVLFYEDFEEGLENPAEDSNLLLFGFMALSKRFLSVQGGTAVTGSYFGGTNIVLVKHGRELRTGEMGYFHRFSNATVVKRTTDKTFLKGMKKHM